MSLRRLCITIAAALLAVGVAACNSGDTETVTVQSPSGDAEGTSAKGTGETVKMIASVPPTDHG
jgi:ribose transport system substrate-binding protein